MPKHLLIVESPAKAKTIEKILGKDFTVKSSYGHVRDLEKGNSAVDVENHFQPTYVIPDEKRKVVNELKNWVKKVDEVWLATDEDREGEAISWHLAEVLGLDQSTKRIVFREITPPAIKKAIDSPRIVDANLVNAQQARRILDRLVGYELSGLLWKKVKGKLSAGRVQSVAVKLIVEREREINRFEVSDFFATKGHFLADDKKKIKAELNVRLSSKEEAKALLEASKGAKFTVESVVKKPSKRNPSAPFTTSTLQQEASRKLGFSVKRTMSVAQRLYEQGHITYMRTDSTSLSDLALQNLATEISTNFGERYLHTRQFKSKKKLAQEAHEAIRPTYVEKQMVSTDRDQQRLYELIWKRTVASQMASAELEKTEIKITSPAIEPYFVAKGEVLLFDGFLKVYLEATDDEDNEETKEMLPAVKEGEALALLEANSTQRFSKPPARYTEASLVKKLEELGIGRPSTYAPTISRIMEEGRGYITKESRDGKERKYTKLILEDLDIKEITETEISGATKNRLYSSDIGMVVVDFLDSNFQEIMDYNFTADIEKKFDTIADGKLGWTNMLDTFYHPFHKNVEETTETADRAKGERVLGTEEGTGHTILTRLSRYGQPIIQIGRLEELPEGEKPRFANLKIDQSIASITLEDALKLFELPKILGTYKGHELTINSGRYGPYVKFDSEFVSLPTEKWPALHPKWKFLRKLL